MPDDPSEPPPTRRPTPPPVPQPVLPLEYSKEPPPARGAFGARVLLGCAGYILLSVIWCAAAVRLRFDPGFSWGVWLLATVALLGLSLYVRVRYRRAGYGYGILLSFGIVALLVVGLVLLVIGMCFTGKLK